ncbi:hypothetical protein ACLE20_12805 [Rhizobium sp. YIM 134829]
MTFGTIFYLYLLPATLAGSVWGAIWIGEWRTARRQKLHPGE